MEQRTGLFSRIFGTAADPRDQLRPLWHRIVALARDPALYSEHGVADTVTGRFDMITAVLAPVLARLEADETTQIDSVYLTELFVEDMDGQLREMGLGDPTVGKHIGKMMGVTGGRLDAYRKALAADERDVFVETVKRNIEMADETNADGLAARLARLARSLSDKDRDALLAAEIDW